MGAMTMSLSQTVFLDRPGETDAFEILEIPSSTAPSPSRGDFHVLRDKLKPPRFQDVIERPRLQQILKRSAEQFPATLICGRAGTGKSFVALRFASSFKRAAWLSVDSTDVDWRRFSKNFAACLSKISENWSDEATVNAAEDDSSQTNIARFLVNQFATLYPGSERERRLVVLEDIHHLFDASWFEEFFALLLYSAPPSIHLMMLCRSKPPGPLWRLRSKQILNVVDERVLAFDIEETAELFRFLGVETVSAHEARRRSFGRVSRLLEIADESISL